MFESISGRRRFSAIRAVPLLVALGATISAVGSVSAQAASPIEPVEKADSTIEWNFRPASVAGPAVSLQERWAAPFAVQSRGQPVSRPPREVVVLRDSVAARRVAAAQVAVGESAAEVTVDPAGGPAADTLSASESTTSPSNAATGTSAAAPTTVTTHKVTRGDTLFGIARRYGVTPAAVRSANRMTDDVVRLGQTLVIPREEASR